MKDKIMALLAVIFLASPTFAGGEIKEFLAFERQKRVSYNDAVEEHQKSHKPVVVWVGFSDLEAYKQLKDDYVNVFVKDFKGSRAVKIVVGDTQNGQFLQIGDFKIPYDKAEEQTKAVVDGVKKLAPKKAASPSVMYNFAGGCANGQCGTMSGYMMGGCANGQCGRR